MSKSMLHQIFDRQEVLQKKSYGITPKLLANEDRAEYIRSMVLALEDELHEALAETGWKPWAKNPGWINEEAFGGELVDALHFLVNLFLVIGWDPDRVHAAYMSKAEKNAKRQEQGYDGVTGKCRSCGRARDDDAVTCTEIKCSA